MDHADPRTVTAGGTGSEIMSREGRSALFGAWFGFLVDMFDVYLPIVALAPAMEYFQPKSLDAGTVAIINAAVFASTLVGRPIGALIFGHFADRLGRRRTTIASVIGFGVVTLLIALMPGYQAWGFAAIVLLIALRFVDGVFLGGEYTGATPLAMEYSPRRKRGFYGGTIMTGYPLAYCLVAVITFVLLQIMPAAGLDSAYVQWGWRIPFVIGALLAFGFVFWFARSVTESESWQQSEKPRRPLVELLRGKNLTGFLQVFVLMTGLWLVLNMISAVLPGLLKKAAGLSDSATTLLLVISYATLAGTYVAAGSLSQRIGRRPFLIAAGLVDMTLVPLGYGLLISGSVTAVVALAVLLIVLNALALSTWGVVTPYINERFSTGVRASGFGLGYSLAVIIPSFYAFFQKGLTTLMPQKYTALVLLVVGGALIAVGAVVGPETRNVEMHPVLSARR
jgi:MFS family permease